MMNHNSTKEVKVNELDDYQKNILRNINRLCMIIDKQKGLNCEFNKIEFLEKEGFYDK